MRRMIARALPAFYRSFLYQRLRQPGAMVVEAVIPLGAVVGACLFADNPAPFALPFLALGLPVGMTAASAWDFGVLVSGGFWRRARVAPAGGTLVFAAVAFSALTEWTATALLGYSILLAEGTAGIAGLPWILASVFCLAPAFSALGLAVFAVLRNPVSAVTATPFAYGALSLLVLLPATLERRLGIGGAAWIARFSPVDLEIRLWQRACSPLPDPAGALSDAAACLGFMLAGLLALRLLLRVLETED
jgi:hypothetical protein